MISHSVSSEYCNYKSTARMNARRRLWSTSNLALKSILELEYAFAGTTRLQLSYSHIWRISSGSCYIWERVLNPFYQSVFSPDVRT